MMQRVFLWLVVLCALSAASIAQANSSREQIREHERRAAQFLQQSRPDQAIPEFKAILKLDPNNADAHGNLGAILFFQNNYAEAIPHLRAAVKLHPALARTRALLGMAEKRTGDYAGALKDMEAAFPKIDEEKIKVESGMELIELYSASNDLDKAGSVIDALESLYPTNPQILYTAYRIHSDLASQAMLSLSIVAPKSAQAQQMTAHELARRGDTESAIKSYRDAMAVDPNAPGLHFELAELLNSLGGPGNQAEAKKEYEAAISANALDEKAECRLGDIAYREGDMTQSQAHYSRALSLQPNDPDASVGLARVLAEARQPDKAQALLEHAIQIDPTSPLAHFRLSAIYRQEGRTEDAKREVEQYQKYKDMKEKLRDVSRELRLQPAQPDNPQPDDDQPSSRR